MSTLAEQIQYGISQFEKVHNIVDVQVEEPSELINSQIGYVPSKVFVLTVMTYVSVTPAIIKFVIPISVIMTPGHLTVPEYMITNLAYNLVLRPIDNSIQDHTFSDNLTDPAFTLYLDPNPDTPNPKLFRPIPLRGVDINEYRGGPEYDSLIAIIKQQPHVRNVFGNIVVDPKLIPVQGQTFIAFSIETDIPLKNAMVLPERPCIMTDTISCMIIVDIREINSPDTVVRQINERLDEYEQLL